MRIITAIALTSLSLLPGLACTNTPGTGSARVQPLEEKSTAVRLQATIYEMKTTPEKLAELDAARLAAMDLSRLPADAGEARVLYRIDQNVSLAGDRVTVGSQEPMVTNTRMTDKGQRINSVQYNQVGALVDFKAVRTGPRQLEVTSKIELAVKNDSAVEIGPGVNSSIIRKATLSLNGSADLGKPIGLISGDASTRDKDGKAIVYFAKVVLGAAAQ